MFKVLIKIENYPAIVLGDSRLSLGLERLTPFLGPPLHVECFPTFLWNMIL